MGFSNAYKKISVKAFGWLADRTIGSFKSIERPLKGSEINMLLRAWVSIIYFTTFLVYFVSLVLVYAVGKFIGFEFVDLLYLLVFLPVLSASISFVTLYIYPIQKAKSIKRSIEKNLPFALIHMNAVVSSGMPPEFMFELISKFKEYGKLSNQAERIVRNIKTFGMSSVAAINDAIKRCPSKKFRQILAGIGSTIERGGNLTYYLKEMSEKTLFEYRNKRQKQAKTLSMLSDIYTAILITGPLMIISVIVMMNIIGGDIFGLGTGEAMFLMILFVSAANVIYLIMLEIMYPE